MEITLKELVDAVSPIGQAEISSTFSGNCLGLRPGLKVVIRTVTYHYAGEVRDIGEGRVKLRQASWIADSGRWSDFLSGKEAIEIEMYPAGVSVSLASIVDWSEIVELPNSSK